MAGIAAAMVVTALYSLAALVRDEKELYELQLRADRLRRDFAKQLNAEPGEIIVVDEVPPED